MRDKSRISPLCIEFAVKWMNTFPDWRFMQVINNFMRWAGSDCFYLEDDKFIDKFKEFCDAVTNED